MTEAKDSSDKKSVRRSPWAYVVTLYLPFGLMSGMLNAFPASFFKLLGYPNALIGILSSLGLFSALRFLYAPWLDSLTTKRRLSLYTLSAAAAAFSCMALLVYSRPGEVMLAIGMGLMLFSLAFILAAHETASDGFYIRALSQRLQAKFIGIKTAAIRIGALTAVMGLLYGATKLAAFHGAIDATSIDKTGFYIGFSGAYLVAAASLVAFFIWNRFALPRIPEDQPVKQDQSFAFVRIVIEYIRQPGAVWMISVILLYRFGEGFLTMKVPFYLDPIDAGGLASSAAAIPLYTILTDVPWSITGGILGGFIIKWFGLKRTFIPLALCMSLPNFFYVWLSLTQPSHAIQLFSENLNTALIIGSSVESLGYGASFAALFYYMHAMATQSGRNKTSILAISFAVMNVGWFLPGMLSGFVQHLMGYTGMFVLSATIGLFAVALIPFLRMPMNEEAGS